MHHSPGLPALLAVVLLAACHGEGAGVGVPHSRYPARHDPSSLHDALAGTNPPRRTLARFSVEPRYAPCAVPDSLRAPVVCGREAAPLPATTTAVAARAAARLREGPDVEALHTSALVDLLWGDSRGNALSRSLVSLYEVVQRAPSAEAYADLAAAELMRADETGDPRARLAALEASVRAVHLDSLHPRARFNLAAAAMRLGLDGSAVDEWSRYLALDSTTSWGREADAWRTRLSLRAAAPVPARRLAPSALDAAVTRDAGAVRTEGVQELGWWATAALAGRHDEANAARATAAAMARALARRGGDSSLLRMVRETSGDRAPRAYRRHAAAVAAYAAGESAASRSAWRSADSAFAAAERLAPGRTLGRWARGLRSTNAVFLGAADPTPALHRTLAEARRHGDGALEARAQWTLGVLLLRADRRVEGRRAVRRAETLFRRSGERDRVAAVYQLLGEEREASGDTRAALQLYLDAASVLRRFRTSVRLRNVVSALARQSSDAGYHAAAAYLHVEESRIALASGHPDFHLEARLAALTDRLRAGDTAGTRRAYPGVAGAIVALPPSAIREWLRARAIELGAELGQESAAALDTAVAFFAAQHNGVRLAGVLLARAHRNLATDHRTAEADLDRALAILRQRGAQYRTATERHALDRPIGEIAGALALTRLARGDTVGALGVIDRARGAANPLPRRLPPGLLVLDFASIADTLLTWRIAGGRVTLHRQLVAASELRRLRTMLAGAAERDGNVTVPLRRMYDLLVRPHAALLQGAERLVLVGDDDIAMIPFAALCDSSRADRYLLEDVAISTVSTIEEAIRGSTRLRGASALFVGDPATPLARSGEAPRLAGASAEVDASRRFYRSARVLSGPSATRPRMVQWLADADIVHVAAHLRFDDDHPESSHLLLAPSGPEDDGRLAAGQVTALPLARTRLVILATCESLRAGRADAPVTVGFARAFRDVGVPGVVGALWRVDDRASARLMTALHARLARGVPVATALREAQLALLRDPAGQQRSPAAWGAFQLSGS